MGATGAFVSSLLMYDLSLLDLLAFPTRVASVRDT